MKAASKAALVRKLLWTPGPLLLFLFPCGWWRGPRIGNQKQKHCYGSPISSFLDETQRHKEPRRARYHKGADAAAGQAVLCMFHRDELGWGWGTGEDVANPSKIILKRQQEVWIFNTLVSE